MGKRSIEGWYEKDDVKIPFKGEIMVNELTNEFIGKIIEESEWREAEILGFIINEGNKLYFIKDYCQADLHHISYSLIKKNEKEFFGTWVASVPYLGKRGRGDQYRTLGGGRAALVFV